MVDLAWKIRRLRVMGVREIAFRSGRAMQAAVESLFARHPEVVPAPDMAAFGQPWPGLASCDARAETYFAAADRVLAGRFDVFELRDLDLGFPPDWNREPRTGIRPPMTFGKTIDYRRRSVVGDVRYLWELNRHLELVTLAQAYHLGGGEKYAEGCAAMLRSWFEACPYPLGGNWISALEHAVRLLNWAVTWHLLGGHGAPVFAGAEGGRLRQDWLAMIYRHCRFIAGHLSRHSSANNHLFGEYVGLFVASVTWPCWRRSAGWRETARAGIEAEARRQVAPDGVNREQSVWYHHEVADMMTLAGLLGRANGIDFSPSFWDRLERMLEFIAALADAGGALPMIGDSDDAHMVRFVPDPAFDVFRSLLATGAGLFSRRDFRDRAGHCDDRTRWLLGQQADAEFAAADAAPPRRPAFPEGGYWILADRPGDPEREVRVVADAGALGYLGIAAHGHADALSLVLSVAGREILVDPGTYAYGAEPRWREYFRGTAAHNTVRIDGLDQSVSGGAFLWIRHAEARCELFREEPALDTWVGSHDGYWRLSDPLRHRRRIELDKAARQVRVTDSFQCRRDHRAELYWHFSEHCDVRAEGGFLRVANGPVVAWFSMEGAEEGPLLVRGDEATPQGWVSRSYGTRVPAWVAIWRGRVGPETEWRTGISLGEPGRSRTEA